MPATSNPAFQVVEFDSKDNSVHTDNSTEEIKHVR